MKRLNCALLLAAILLLGNSKAAAQTLYLLKGAIRPSGSSQPWRTQLLSVNEKAGTLEVARDLGTDKFAGIAFCLVNYEHHVLVIGLPADQPTTFMVLDMDDAANPAILQPDFNDLPGLTWEPYPAPLPDGVKLPGEAHASDKATLLFHTGLGLVLNLELFGPRGTAMYGIPLRRNPRAAGRGLSFLDRAAFISSGTIGLGFQSQTSAETVSPYDTNLKIRPKSRGEITLPVPSPAVAAAVKSAGRPMWLFASDDRMMAINGTFLAPDSTKPGDGSSTLYLRDKRGAKWQTLTVPGNAPAVRSIGRYLLGIAHSQAYQRDRESAGKAEYEEITKNVRWQDGIAASGAHHEGYYPGILFAIDPQTGKMFQWRTDQADSEILWADDSAFYYRRANELLKVNLINTANGPVIGPALSILKADILLDVHAAFRGK